MDKETAKKLLIDARTQFEQLTYNDDSKLDALCKKTKMYIDKIFSSESEYKTTFNNIHFSPTIVWGGMSDLHYRDSWRNGKSVAINLINTMLEDIELSEATSVKSISEISSKNNHTNTKIFIVHGHNEQMKESVARVLEKLSLVPIILHEQANKGRTIIEKFSDHSEVGFAVVLLSADDIAHSIKQKPEDARLRARQNVILELGYFLGKLGRHRVAALIEPSDNFEFPSDYQGVVYIPFDSTGNWKFSLLKELKSCGYDLDANALI